MASEDQGLSSSESLATKASTETPDNVQAPAASSRQGASRFDDEMSDWAHRLEPVAAKLRDDLKRVRREGDVDGAMSAFLGSSAVRDLFEAVRQAPSRKGRRSLKGAFREAIDFLYEGAASFKHCLKKPYGYPGDYMILEHVYAPRSFHGTTDASMGITDIWGLKSDLARAVRKRKDALRFILEDELTKTPEMSVLSVACGAAREVRELPEALLKNAKLTLLDSDPRALAVAAGHAAGLSHKVGVETLHADIISGKGVESIEPKSYDLVYSFGLYDYLDDKTLLPVIERTLTYLKEGGEYIFCLKDKTHYEAEFYDIFFDWTFVPRVAADGVRLAEAAGLKVESMLSVKHGTVLIYRCRRA